MLIVSRHSPVTGAGGFLGTTVASTILEVGGDVVCLDVMEAPKGSDWGKCLPHIAS